MDKFTLFGIILSIVVVIVPCWFLYLHDKKHGKLGDGNEKE